MDMSKIIKSFCYWYGPMKMIHHLFFKSFLIQQQDNFVIDMYVENCNNLQSFFSQYTAQELKRINIIAMNWNNVIDKSLIFHDFNTLKKENLALLSDYCRILTFIKTSEYTFYFDMDICFLQSFVPFLDNRAFVYTWGNSESGNSAIIKADMNTSAELRRLLISTKTPHPLEMFKKSTNKINILSCALFDPQWFTDEFDLPFENHEMSKMKMMGYVGRYKSYAVHWHNKWNTHPESIPDSWIGMMYNKYVKKVPQNIGSENLMNLRGENQIEFRKLEATMDTPIQMLHGESVKKVSNCTYGSTNYNIDVTEIFRSYFIQNGKIVINKDVPFNGIFGDPLPGVSKRLRFSLNNSNYVVSEHRDKDVTLHL